MTKKRFSPHLSLALVVVLMASACASVGSGDPVAVRAEDLLTNSLTIYTGAITWHDAPGHSVMESPAVYKAMEMARAKFPTAWKALKEGIKTYKVDRQADKIQALINAVQEILNTIPPIPAGGK
jgi:hypothetical protein